MALFVRHDKTPLGIYVHIPFCRSKCQYCDFYSLSDARERVMDDYLRAICTHIREAGPLAPAYRVDTVYFGGGTPSYFGEAGIATIMNTIRKHFDVDSNAEITFEANPDSVTPRLLRRLRAEGFNRVSLGIQTDDDAILRDIGRPHTYRQAIQAVKQIRQAGFENLSVDLMYGLPGQTLEGWKKTVENVMQLQPEHISCYGLKLEEGTPLYARQNECNLPDDDQQADMYLAAVELLQQKGYRQYEISNFAQRGMASKHNLKYWNGGEYLGFGPDASSDFAGKRFSMIRDIRTYISGVTSGGQVLRESQELQSRDRAGEYLMLRLRTSAGISREEYEKRYLLSFDPLAKILDLACQHHLAQHNGHGSYRLTPEGFLVSNSILSDLLLAQETSETIGTRL
jgi:oxygen-independent coproporphyrinogen-3 oxidase